MPASSSSSSGWQEIQKPAVSEAHLIAEDEASIAGHPLAAQIIAGARALLAAAPGDHRWRYIRSIGGRTLWRAYDAAAFRDLDKLANVKEDGSVELFSSPLAESLDALMNRRAG